MSNVTSDGQAYRTARRCAGTVGNLPIEPLRDQIRPGVPTSLVGNHGTGKSTLARRLVHGVPHRWVTHRPGEPWWTRLAALRLGAHRLSQLPTGPPTIWVHDGFDSLPLPVQWIVRYHARILRRRMLVTTHRPLAGFAVLHHCHVDPSVVTDLVQSHLRGQPQSICDDVRRHTRHRLAAPGGVGNLRELWFELYDVAALGRHREPCN